MTKKHIKSPTPILKWAGGKSSLASDIYKHLNTVKSINRYIEPFFGGGAVYFHIAENDQSLLRNSIINDSNKDLMELYKNIKCRQSYCGNSMVQAIVIDSSKSLHMC